MRTTRDAVRAVGSSLLAGSAVLLAACADAPVTGPVDVDMVSAPSFATTGISDCSATAGVWAGKRSIEVTVKIPDGTAAKNTVVAVVNPQSGPICWGKTDNNGYLALNNLAKDTPFFLTIRDEVSLDAVKLEVVPPVPSTSLDFSDDPTKVSSRAAPVLVRGAACTSVSFTTGDYLSALSGPCILPAKGLALTVQLPGATKTYDPTFIGPNGQGISGVVVAALTPFAGDYNSATDVAAACAAIPFLQGVLAECQATNGPAFVQAMDVTGSDGKLSNKLWTNNQLIILEAVAQQGGETLFGTFVTGATNPTILLSPGICTVEHVDDESEPAGMADVDILYAEHGIGLSLGDAGGDTSLDPDHDKLVVKLVVDVNNDGGVGDFTLKGRFGPFATNHTARADFSVTPGGCSVTGWSGSLTTLPGVAVSGRCTASPTDADGDYTLFFTLDGLPQEIVEAQYSIRTDGDHLDPQRSGAANYERGSIPFTDLMPQACPVRLNNDGKWSFT